MADENTPELTASHRPDPVLLVAGLAALGISAWALLGGAQLLAPQWLLAVGAVLIGTVMLIASMITRRGS